MADMPPEEAILFGSLVAHFLENTYRWDKAIDVHSECLVLLNQLPVSVIGILLFMQMKKVIRSALSKGVVYLSKRGLEYYRCDHFKESINYLEKALFILKQIYFRHRIPRSHLNLGRSLLMDCQYDRAIEHFEKALAFGEITGYERQEVEASAVNNIGEVHYFRGNYEEAVRCHQKALAISLEIGCENEQAVSYNNLGVICDGYPEKRNDALFYHKKALEIHKKLGNRKEEASSYCFIAHNYEARGEHKIALEYFEKAGVVSKEIMDKKLEGTVLASIINISYLLFPLEKVIEYQERRLEIMAEIGENKASGLAVLGFMYSVLGDYGKGIQRLKQGIKLSEEVGDLNLKAICYHLTGKVYGSLGDDDKAMMYLKKCTGIYQAVGDDEGLCLLYCDIGEVCRSVGLYQESLENLEKALKISKEIGSRIGEATSLTGLGNLNFKLGKHDKATECGEKALEIAKEICVRGKEVSCYILLGNAHLEQGHYEKVIEYELKALEMMKQMGKRDQQQFIALQSLGLAYASQGDFLKARNFLLECIQHHQSRRTSLENGTKLLLDGLDFPSYKVLSLILLRQKKVNDALFILELGRGCVLADLIATKYGIEGAPGTNKVTSSALHSFLKNQKKNFLFIAFLQDIVALWFVHQNGNIVFKKGLEIKRSREKKHYLAEFGLDPSRSFHDNQEVNCEDRSLSALLDDGSLSAVEQIKKPNKHGVRKVEEEQRDNRSFLQYMCGAYRALIAPIVDLIDYPEIIIAPEGAFFQTPFASLRDENGRYLSERVRIRLIPSLTTLKLIQDSPADYHCQSGALIVGDPKVGPVVSKAGNIVQFPRLPKAREEAKMISRLLGVPCLVGEQATKEEVLRRIQEVSLVHIAAHGDAERGEIALAPNSSVTGIPKEDDFLLTMKDIASIDIRAKLVVLSCHSASGKILTAEGIVGIARDFLGSGARSVLMSLWAIDDDATKAFMNIFYKCLIREKMSASEALHQAMNKMRESLLYSDVKYWAPFVLLGDDVSLNF